jgi:hypothetical protein
MNIARILKYCPKGTKLYSTVFGEVKFSEIYPDDMIVIIIKDNSKRVFHKDGSYSEYGECVLFPFKDQRDWKKFRLPVKKGDIMMMPDGSFPFITNGTITKSGGLEYVCGVISTSGNFRINSTRDILWTEEFCIPASKEAKKELFDKMKEAGYRWNADTLELEKIGPKFKEGDVLINSETNTLFLSVGVMINDKIQGYYLFANDKFAYSYVSISLLKLASITDRNKLFSTIVKGGYKYDKEQHKLVKQKFKPFDKVLIRDEDNQTWRVCLFSHYRKDLSCPYVCVGCSAYKQCIPYEGNEYLLGTTDSLT